MIKAIETEYGGRLYRSRIEAKWAVFFDLLGIEYWYEKEGYDLDGIWYLPDFWLPSLDIWVEIKGPSPTIQEREKIVRLAKASKKRTIILWGDIPLTGKDFSPNYCIATLLLNGKAKIAPELGAYWCECPICKVIGFTSPSSPYPPLCLCSSQNPHLDVWEVYPQMDSPRLIEAYKKAGMMRFEHRNTSAKISKIKIADQIYRDTVNTPLLSQDRMQETSYENKNKVSVANTTTTRSDTFDQAKKVVDQLQKLNITIEYKNGRIATLKSKNGIVPEKLWRDVGKCENELIEYLTNKIDGQELFYAPTLTTKEIVREHLPAIFKHIRATKGGSKIAVGIINAFDFFDVEEKSGILEICIRVESEWLYGFTKNHLKIIEWAIEIEIKKKCRLIIIRLPQR